MFNFNLFKMHEQRKLFFSTTNIGLCLLLLLLLVTYSQSISLPSKFFYDNQEQHAELQLDNETAPDESKSQPTNLKLLGENGGEEIPLEFFSQMDNITDIDELIDLLVPKDTIDPQYGTTGKNSKRNVERAMVRQAKSASCLPENTVVRLLPLEPSKDPGVIYFPKCTRVKRCSGCCTSELMACEPLEVEAVSFELAMVCPGSPNRYCGKDVAVVEEHKRCKCNCRMKEKDCNAYQYYSREECLCKCTNEEEKAKCISMEHKIWDEKDCRCVCRESDNCTTGTMFDENECKCIDPGFKGFSPSVEDRRRFIIKAVAVDPDNSTIYNAN